MSWTESFPSLLAICGGAPDEYGAMQLPRAIRGAAARLLAAELIARVNLTSRNHDPRIKRAASGAGDELLDLAPVPSHFAWRDYQSADPYGGPRRADQYMWWSTTKRHHFPGIGTVPKAPSSQGEHDLTLVFILQQAAIVFLAATTEIGAEELAAATTPYREWLETHYPDLYPSDS